jgi:hypothetical protein
MRHLSDIGSPNLSCPLSQEKSLMTKVGFTWAEYGKKDEIA